MPSQDFSTIVTAAVQTLNEQLDTKPLFYIHLGGHFAAVADRLLDSVTARIPLRNLNPALPEDANADGFVPELRFGLCRGVPTLLLTGERRLSEGVNAQTALFSTALAGAAGIRNHVFVDTGLSLNPDLKAGHWAMLTDFINGYGFSPIDGLHGIAPNHYPDLTQAFSQHLNSELLNALANFGPSPMLCTYIGVPGFHIPTPAEARRHRNDGADVIGHELVLHLMLAAAFGCDVSAMVLAAAQLLPMRPATALTRHDVQSTTEFCTPQLLAGLQAAIADIAQVQSNGLTENTLPDADADDIIHQNIRKAAAAGHSSPLRAFLPPKR